MLRSPNELFEKGCELMLDGRKPESKDDWALLANFWAVNIASEACLAGVNLLVLLFDAPLGSEEIEHIVEFQLAQREAGNVNTL